MKTCLGIELGSTRIKAVAIDGRFKPVHIICRAMWSFEDPPQYTGAIGKVLETREEENR